MRLVLERLPASTLVSVAHRVELEAFHTRKLVLENADAGAELVGDEVLHQAARSRDVLRPVPRPRPAREVADPVLTPSRTPAAADYPDFATASAFATTA